LNSSNGLNKRLFSWSIEEIRHGQLWPVSIALTLIIACVFALSALAERMEQVIVKQGKDALTADSVFISANPIPQPLLDIAQLKQLESSQLTRFSTMAFSDNAMQLVTVKAVESNYPLRGEMVLEGADNASNNHVEPGELWLDERIFTQLEVEIGDNVTIGDANLTITGRISQEPGLSFNPFQQMPAVLIHNDDIDATGAIQPGSRVSFRLFLNGDDAKLKAAQDSIELTPSDRWRTQDSASRTNDMFERTTQYLSLTVAIVVIMAATTLVLTCQHYVASRRKTIAMLKSLGASKQWIIKWLSVQVSLLVVIGAVLGIAIGIGLEFLLRIPLGDLLPSPLPSYGIEPAILSIVSSILIGIPALGIPLLGLVNTSAISVIQSNHKAQNSHKKFALLLVPIIPMILMYGDNLLVWIVLAGIVGLFLILAVVSTVVLRLFSKLPTSTSMRLAISRINRTPLATGIQFGSLALSLMLLQGVNFILRKKSYYGCYFRYKKLFFEKYVTLSNDNKKIKFLHKKASANLIKSIQDLNLISSSNIIEYPVNALEYLEIIAKKINKFDGGILTFDYGYVQKKSQNTLQSVKKHRYTNPFIKPGHSDITSHINFKLFHEILKKNNLNVKKITTQNEFLKKIGILERANILSEKMTFKAKASMFYRLKRLLDYKEMGSLFKVIFAQKKDRKFSLGF